MGREWRLRALFFFVRNHFSWCFRGGIAACLALALAGCGTQSQLLSDVLARVWADGWGSKPDPTVGATLNPQFRYLKVEVLNGPVALMVLGAVDPHPLGEVEVWYSAGGEVIKTLNGRIVGTAGLETDWRSVRFSPMPAAWSHVGAAGASFVRVRDQMPGYRYGVTEHLEVRAWAGPPPAGSPGDMGARQRQLRWFRESAAGDAGLPPSWFAWGVRDGRAAIVYSEQCLSATLCLRLTPWPVRGSEE